MHPQLIGNQLSKHISCWKMSIVLLPYLDAGIYNFQLLSLHSISSIKGAQYIVLKLWRKPFYGFTFNILFFSLRVVILTVYILFSCVFRRLYVWMSVVVVVVVFFLHFFSHFFFFANYVKSTILPWYGWDEWYNESALETDVKTSKHKVERNQH